MNIKFYKSRDWKRCGLVAYLLVDLDSKDTNRTTGQPYFMSYAPIGQHSECHPDYLRYKCTKITKQEYMEVSKNLYTPREYLA